MKNLAIIKIAGKGTRIHTNVPKQFVEVHGKPVFIYTLEAFEKSKLTDAISVVTSEEYLDFVKETCKKFNITKAKFFSLGDPKYGNGSTFNGYKEALDNDYFPDYIISHDGVRALITPEDIDGCIEKCIDSDNGISQMAKELVGSILFKNNHWEVINRNEVLELATPIILKNKIFNRLYTYYQTATDEQKEKWFGLDTMFMEEFAHCITPYVSDKINFKITTDSDLQFFKDLIEMRFNKNENSN